jgi:hypothetical protein
MLWILALYFAPVIVAAMRGYHNVGSIAVINIFLGWTFVGWVVALAMAFGQVRPANTEASAHQAVPDRGGHITLRMADRWDRWQHRNDLFCGGCGAKRTVADALYCLDCGGVFLRSRGQFLLNHAVRLDDRSERLPRKKRKDRERREESGLDGNEFRGTLRRDEAAGRQAKEKEVSP